MGTSFSSGIALKRFTPFVLRFEDQFDRFARRAATAGLVRHEMGAFAYFVDGVRDGDRQSHAAHDGQVGQVVAYVGDLVVGEAFGGFDLFVDGEFVVNALMEAVDLQFAGAGGEGRRDAAADYAELQTGLARELQTLPVVDVEDFQAFHYALTVEGVMQAAVGQDAVAIQQQEFYMSGARDDFVRNVHSSSERMGLIGLMGLIEIPNPMSPISPISPIYFYFTSKVGTSLRSSLPPVRLMT